MIHMAPDKHREKCPPLDTAMAATLQPPAQKDRKSNIRTLQIEAAGDPYQGLIKPKIRLTGRWLEHAGFAAGQRVEVACLAPGLIQLRSPSASQLAPEIQPAPDKGDTPF